MEIAEASHGAVLVLSPQGRLDSITAPAFERLVRGRLADGQRRIVIDLDALDYISSAGLRVLLVAAKALKAARGQIALCRVKGTVMAVLRVSAFDRIFTILPSLDQAIAQLGDVA
jgi:anti-anti-sigma factor